MNFIKAAFGVGPVDKARPWSKTHYETFERLRSVNQTKLQRQLIDISTLLDGSFDYRSEAECCTAMEAFLNAWNHILACIEDWNTQLRALCLDVVAKIAARDEYSIVHLRMNARGQTRCSVQRVELMRCYAAVLRTTQAWAGDRMMLWQPVQEFCARILAISMLRLPEVHSLVCSALSGIEAISVAQAQTAQADGVAAEQSVDTANVDEPESPTPSVPAATGLMGIDAEELQLSASLTPDQIMGLALKEPATDLTEDAADEWSLSCSYFRQIDTGFEHIEPAGPPLPPPEDPLIEDAVVTEAPNDRTRQEDSTSFQTNDNESVSPSSADSEAQAAAIQALARAEAAEARALLSPGSPAKRSEPDGFLQRWWHVAGEGRGRSSNLEWLSQAFAADSPRRLQFFCLFLTYLSKQCAILRSNGFTVPGSEEVESAAASRLKALEPRTYPNSLIEACSSWLQQQPESLDAFLEAALSQMNVYDNNTVVEATRYMAMWIQAALPTHANKQAKQLPPTVKLDFTIQAIQVLLSSDSFQVTLRTIVFLYDNINSFPFDARNQLISTVLLEKCFFRLFLHWLAEVRTFFCNLLVFKVFRTSRFDVFREMQEMDHLSQLELSVPTHLGRNRANDSFDEEKMQDFCLMAKFAFYIGAPLQHLDNSSVGIVQIGDTILRSQQLVYSGAAIRQLKDCINESYEWGLHEAPQMLPKGVMSSR